MAKKNSKAAKSSPKIAISSSNSKYNSITEEKDFEDEENENSLDENMTENESRHETEENEGNDHDKDGEIQDTKEASHSVSQSQSSELSSFIVLTPQFLEGYKNKMDLVRRLQMIMKELSNEELVPDVESMPGLDALSALLVSSPYLQHKYKEVRLYTCLACMEVFAIYAPEAPYDAQEVFDIFEQVICQLGNLSHTTSASQTNYHNYYRLLEHLSEVKTGIVLVEYCRGYSGSPTTTSSSSKKIDADSDQNTAQQAIDLLADLMQVLLESIQIEHLQDVKQHAIDAIAACIGEFQHVIPIRILDVLLAPISKGRKALIHPAVRDQVGGNHNTSVRRTSPCRAAKQKSGRVNCTTAPIQLEEVDSIPYMLAAKVIQITKDKCSTPIASLLNGVLNGDPFTLKYSSVVASDPDSTRCSGPFSTTPACNQTSDEPPNVYNIVYELHRFAPDILTTVIGTIATSLRSEDATQRHMIVKLLGRLFYSTQGMIAVRFITCFKEWCSRCQDTSITIRSTMVSTLIKTLRTYSKFEGHEAKELRDEATKTLQRMVSSDPNASIRNEAIHQVCDLCMTTPQVVAPSLLRAIGDRIKAKQTTKAEIIDALTGLSQLYHTHYLRPKLQVVQKIEVSPSSATESASPLLEQLDINASCIDEVLSFATKKSSPKNSEYSEFYYGPEHAEEKFLWIAKLVLESAWYTDHSDIDMRNRVIQIIDDVLWSNPGKKIIDGESASFSDHPLSPTSRALGFALVLNSLIRCDECKDSALVASKVEDTNAYKWMTALLNQRANLQIALMAYIDSRAEIKKHTPTSVEFLKANNAAYSALTNVASFTPTNATEKERILQQVHGARDHHLFRLLSTIATPNHSVKSRIRAFEDLPKRAKNCSLSNESISWIKCCARRCAMGAINVDMTRNLMILTTTCLSELIEAKNYSDVQVPIRNLESLLCALRLLASTFPKMVVACAPEGSSIEGDDSRSFGFVSLQKMFLKLRTEHITLQVSKELVKHQIQLKLCKIIALLVPHSKGDLEDGVKNELLKISTEVNDEDLVYFAVKILSCDEGSANQVFGVLFKNFTEDLSNSHYNTISTLCGLSYLIECFCSQWIDVCNQSGSGSVLKVLTLAMDLLKSGSINTDQDYDVGEIANYKRRTIRSGHKYATSASPNTNIPSVLSLHATKLCAAITFLTSHIRALHNVKRLSGSTIEFKDESNFLHLVVDLVNAKGSHISLSSFRSSENETKDAYARLRKNASLSLFRLIGDNALQLENKYSSPMFWHAIASSLLEEDPEVRSCLVKEWIAALNGVENYGHGKKFAPSLTLLAMAVCCTDSDNHHLMANGLAGHINGLSKTAKDAASQAIVGLRKTCDVVEAQCVAMGRRGEENWEGKFKMKLMPEYSVPYALHYLSHREETPTELPSEKESSPKCKRRYSNIENGQNDEFDSKECVKARYGQLKKRLKWLYDPLINSLGDQADNISFLLQMSDNLGKSFRPSTVNDNQDVSHLAKRLKVVCVASREVLMKFVKKDVNLKNYPGAIQIHLGLFIKADSPVVTDLYFPPEASKCARKSRVSFAKEKLNDCTSIDADNIQREDDSPIHVGASPASLKLERLGNSDIQISKPQSDDWDLSPIPNQEYKPFLNQRKRKKAVELLSPDLEARKSRKEPISSEASRSGYPSKISETAELSPNHAHVKVEIVSRNPGKPNSSKGAPNKSDIVVKLNRTTLLCEKNSATGRTTRRNTGSALTIAGSSSKLPIETSIEEDDLEFHHGVHKAELNPSHKQKKRAVSRKSEKVNAKSKAKDKAVARTRESSRLKAFKKNHLAFSGEQSQAETFPQRK